MSGQEECVEVFAYSIGDRIVTVMETILIFIALRLIDIS